MAVSKVDVMVAKKAVQKADYLAKQMVESLVVLSVKLLVHLLAEKWAVQRAV
jgi:hypothetical protein